ncbi:MAG: Fic family protein [Burkholderiaceae bacterium]
MISGDCKYIWQNQDWPVWRFDLASLAEKLARVSLAQGLLIGRLCDVGLPLRDQASLLTLTEDVLKTSEIEGEHLNQDSVRSSLARRLRLDIGTFVPRDLHVEGIVEMVLDASVNCHEPLDQKRLLSWHASLFPTGYSGFRPIQSGAWRDDLAGPMQVVSGPIGRQKVHFEAPPALQLQAELGQFFKWVNSKSKAPSLIKAALGHLWFVTLHPFEDGNGRIARAIGDMLIARSDGSAQRFYSISAQIQRDRKGYYDILERTQKHSMDVTEWLAWFLDTLDRALEQAHRTLDGVLVKAQFWQHWSSAPFNERQIKLLKRLLDGFEGKLTAQKWGAIGKCSPDTALRDIRELMAHGVLQRSTSGGRSTSYELIKAPESS